MKKDNAGEKALKTIHRRLNILLMFSRKNQELTTSEITKKLRKEGDDIDPSLVLRTLKQLEEAGFLHMVIDEEKEEKAKGKLKAKGKGKENKEDEDEDDQATYTVGKWRLPPGLDYRIKLFPKFSIGEIIGFRLMELLLKPLLPKESYHALQPSPFKVGKHSLASSSSGF